MSRLPVRGEGMVNRVDETVDSLLNSFTLIGYLVRHCESVVAARLGSGHNSVRHKEQMVGGGDFTDATVSLPMTIGVQAISCNYNQLVRLNYRGHSAKGFSGDDEAQKAEDTPQWVRMKYTTTT